MGVVPGVVKMFIWKAGNNILPTRSNLYRKKIVDNHLCPICERHEESVMHANWSCPSASDVWAKSSSPVHKGVTFEENFLELWEKLKGKFKRVAEREWIATTMRRIWLRRNTFIFENQFYSPRKVI